MIIVPSGGNPASQTQTFNQPYTVSNALSTTVTWTFAPPFSTVPSLFFSQLPSNTPTRVIPIADLAFLSVSNGTRDIQTWTSMPTLNSVIFNETNQQHELEVDLTNVDSAILLVDCPVQSNTANAFLQVKWELHNNPTNYLPLAATPSQGQVIIDGINNFSGNCNQGTINIEPATTGPLPFAIAAGAKQVAFLQVYGFGGGGTGDNPQFTQIHLYLYTHVPILCSLSATSLTVTAAVFKVTCDTATSTTGFIRAVAGL